MGMRKPRNSNHNVVGVLPAVVVSVVVFTSYCIGNGARGAAGRDDRAPELWMAGFFASSPGLTYQRLEPRREGRGSQAELTVSLPLPEEVEPAPHLTEPLANDRQMQGIVDLWHQQQRSPGGWHYLTANLRRLIDTAEPSPSRWDRIVLHHSSTAGGNATLLGHYHGQVRGLESGLAYHFVIGNGHFSGNGEIEAGRRWTAQAPSGTLPGNATDPRAISICLIGDFALRPPTPEQLSALEELTQYLRAKLGSIPLQEHQRSGDAATNCPGPYFPRQAITEHLNP